MVVICKFLPTFVVLTCGYGVIGSHDRLRICCREAWGFESLYPHERLHMAVAFFVRLKGLALLVAARQSCLRLCCGGVLLRK